MKNKIKVGVIGATGMVGQHYTCLLENHPWFEVSYVSASTRSAGKKYEEAVQGRWLMNKGIPEKIKGMNVNNAQEIDKALESCDVFFSAISLDKQAVKELESTYAKKGARIISNNSAHRLTKDVPILIPEINADHADIIPMQQKNYGFKKGLIVVKPNCSIQSYMLPIHALKEAGYNVDKVMVSTMQAMSGAGYPGPAGVDMIDNVIPYIPGEEEKSELEPKKIFGRIEEGKFVDDSSITISAHCNRVPVVDGHLANVSIGFASKVPGLDEIINIWENYNSYAVELELPSAPSPAIIYRKEPDRPQPGKDRDAEKGMAVSVGRLRECNLFDYRFTGLSHNTLRGAAGGAVLMAELLAAKGYLD